MSSTSIPSGAVGAFIGVLVYSVICLVLCTLVVGLLFSYGEKWTYITMLATFSAISTVGSIAQQIHYGTSWASIKEEQYQKALNIQTYPGLAFTGASGTLDIVLYNMQLYCYNVMSLSVMFWAVGLFAGTWGFKDKHLRMHAGNLSIASRTFTIAFPALVIGVANIPAVLTYGVLVFILSNMTMFLSLTIGSILLILTLYKYMKTRRLVMGSRSNKLGGWWNPSSGESAAHSQTLESGTARPGAIVSEKRRSIYDRALLIRFTIAFLILAVFEVMIIVFSLTQVNYFNAILASGGPNLEASSATSDILFFMPGVTSSLVVYLVFGTSKSYKQYIELVLGCCGLRLNIQRRRKENPSQPRALEFDRLDSISNNEARDGIQKSTQVTTYNISHITPTS
ncbi:hypothetical protein BJ878DRAFT_191332 [Calycina marina]|uniref:Uncharacterized protein n=1 Tax=Calycina marina TaxID=1763456 RepID=A0A9P7Z8C6_9HELO|nr:hypothetical protein BJ878DRAFT_191332 [Calycina marina]